tara:strand:- start:4281 stop:4835 length:555 start_codon:yes stop_codon:yes gene_type:complete
MAKLHRIRSLRRTLASSSGFTLVEVLLAVSIITVAVGVVGGGIFQVTILQRSWAEDTVATRDLRHTGSLFAKDALNAADALDAPGGSRLSEDCADPPASPAGAVTLTWTDTGGVSRQAAYSATGGVLSRQDEGSNTSVIVSSGVVDGSVKFSLRGSLLTLELQVDAEDGNTETLTLRTFLRKLQ